MPSIKDYKICRINNVEILNVNIENSKTGFRLAVDEVVNQGVVVQFIGNNEFSGTLTGFVNIEKQEEVDEILNSREVLLLELPFGDKHKIFIEENNSTLYTKDLGIYNVKFNFYTSAISSENVVITLKDNLVEQNKKTKESAFKRFANFFNRVFIAVDRINGEINNVLAIITGIAATVRSLGDVARQLQQTLNNIVDTFNFLVATPASLIQAFDDLISTYKSLFTNDDEKENALLNLVNQIELNEVDETRGLFKIQEQQATNLFLSAIIASAIASYIDLLSLKEALFDFEVEKLQKEIEKLQQKISKIYDNEIRIMNEDSLGCLISFLNEKSLFSKKAREYTTELTTSEDVLCYQIYNDVNENLLNNLRGWNDIEEWGLIPANTTIIYYI